MCIYIYIYIYTVCPYKWLALASTGVTEASIHGPVVPVPSSLIKDIPRKHVPTRIYRLLGEGEVEKPQWRTTEQCKYLDTARKAHVIYMLNGEQKEGYLSSY